ncbi:hypothetical protein HMPREF9098_2119 [Kingella denitrificans ATCC 33394]|uniref:Uncharacterized protein n=1 Tax=Kingella denitrificans ATCC 33394 TaxID=888741 RepID=F0F1Y4_9NEIS|nr:hypothetical protein HMPREF9098_2119 [Kingella denitrificans ATCC 33394]
MPNESYLKPRKAACTPFLLPCVGETQTERQKPYPPSKTKD